MDARTSLINGSTIDFIVPLEGDSFDISCASIGAPVPNIRWTFNGQTTRFTQTDSFTDYVISMRRNVMTVNNSYLEATVSPGVAESTLHIRNFQSHDEGIYKCIGSNAGSSITTSSSAIFYASLQGMF